MEKIKKNSQVLVNVAGCDFKNIESLGFFRDYNMGGWSKICASWDEAQEIATQIVPINGKYFGSCKHREGDETLCGHRYDMDTLDIAYYESFT